MEKELTMDELIQFMNEYEGEFLIQADLTGEEVSNE